ncbi:LLM class flavin-dependent oxidoreductase [Lentibacillus salicampi]|uniref:LLM class flavin-dependent oxidoreductase n=1 Tax=Lentibacillus salicampi TaxID=175306 RepID=A0A4Y9AEQ5_9BACI|nr:LLM class flavin-dependent oxidoreductase [Lentibacillus salicampi]TFJ94359.1 LLM class flavin-dependent oxidoreductase [Lentibacillus salicampi]
MKLSVLDQSPISRGAGPEEALDHTLKLAEITEKLGYTRYWVAEHHNTNGLASVSPEILIARIASVTNTIRVGSGGVLLPQYSPYKVAENFKLLEAMFTERIDLGIGRSPGGSQDTQMALLDSIHKDMSEFPRQLHDLQGFLHNTLPKDHTYRLVKAAPRTNTVPPMWVLGLSERGAANAAEIGAGFIFGHFINPEKGQAAMETYRSEFQASLDFAEPASAVCIFVVCADTEAEAEKLATSQDKWLLNIAKGADTKVPSIEEVQKRTYRQEELEIIKKNRNRAVIGTPEQVKAKLERLSDVYQTDEFMIITNIYDFDARVHSYRLLAEAFDL